jgi:primase-polymerase (primpol)-like protein
MATAMNPEPEYTRHEQFIHYAEMLRERFESGMLSELQVLPQWVLWRAELEDGKPKKVPYNPNYAHLQARASVKIRKSWGSLEQALTALESGHFSGLGLMLTPPLVMIDLDHSYDRATQIITDPQAAQIMREVNSYFEASPNDGLHGLVYVDRPIVNLHTEKIEIYGEHRFTTITTDHIAGTPQTIEQRQEALDALYNRFAPPVRETINQNTSGGVGSGATLIELPPEAAYDAALQRLLSGDSAGYKSQSSADFVLIMKLLHWTGDNIDLTRQLFLASPLGQREKSQRKTGGTTYVVMTINNVSKKRRNPPMKR